MKPFQPRHPSAEEVIIVELLWKSIFWISFSPPVSPDVFGLILRRASSFPINYIVRHACKLPLDGRLIDKFQLKYTSNIFQVIVVGAGPSGLVLSLILAKASIKVTLLDSARTIDDRPRAAHYAPSAIRVLNRAGVLEDVRREGFIPKNMTWRKIDGTEIVKITDVSQPWNPEALTVLPLNLLGAVLLSHAEKNCNVTIKWNSLVVDVGSDEHEAWAVIKHANGKETRVTADYLCGCDGGTSQVRRSLFGDKNFPGKTWDAQIIATNVSISYARMSGLTYFRGLLPFREIWIRRHQLHYPPRRLLYGR